MCSFTKMFGGDSSITSQAPSGITNYKPRATGAKGTIMFNYITTLAWLSAKPPTIPTSNYVVSSIGSVISEDE